MSHIGKRQPNDGHEYEVQCARCGSSLDFDSCDWCGGTGLYGHECGEDCCMCADPDEDNVPCSACLGEMTFPRCLAREEWCNANPMPGRESAERALPEWFRVNVEVRR